MSAILLSDVREGGRTDPIDIALGYGDAWERSSDGGPAIVLMLLVLAVRCSWLEAGGGTVAGRLVPGNSVMALDLVVGVPVGIVSADAASTETTVRTGCSAVGGVRVAVCPDPRP